MSDLIITNGDSAAELLAAAGATGKLLPWRDLLHEGPVVPAETIEALSDIRADYLSRRFGLPQGEVRADFAARDAVLRSHGLFDRVTIWVEHDLYDQLQLLQILDFFASVRREEGLVLVQAGDFLGNQTPESVLRFAEQAVEVTKEMLGLGSTLWRALSRPTPEALARWSGRNLPPLPYMRAALERFLQELPAPGSGLSRTGQQVLASLAERAATPQAVFRQVIASEEAAFMGDWSLFRLLEDMAFAPQPLLAGIAAPYPCRGTPRDADAYIRANIALTPFGRAVLAGAADSLAVNGIDRWWGGTRLAGYDSWRYDARARRLVPPARPSPPA